MNQAAHFLSFFEGRHTFQVFDDKGKDPSLARHKSADFDEIESKLIDYNKRGAGIFFTVNETDGLGRKAENVIRVRAVFVDLDGEHAREKLAQVMSAKIRPSLVVESSAHKFHCYWLVDTCSFQEFSEIQKGIAQKFGGDPAVHDIARVMRLPGFYHNKGSPFRTRLVEAEGQSYKIENIIEGLGLAIHGDNSGSAAPIKSIPDKDNQTAEGVEEGKRNQAVFKYACKLRNMGLDRKDAETLVLRKAARCKPAFSDVEARKCLDQAYKYPQGEPGIFNSDLANSERLIKRFGENIRYSAATGWLTWNDKYWENHGEAVVAEYAKETARGILIEAKEAKGDRAEDLFNWAKTSQSSEKIRAMISLAASAPEIGVSPDKFDNDPWLLNCANGALNLKNGKLMPHSRADLCTRIAAASYGTDSSEAKLWLQFIEDITGKKADLARYLQRVAGYCLTSSISEKAWFFFYGGGNNGKSVFIEVLHDLLGSYAIALNKQCLIKQRGFHGVPNDVARLNGPRLATVSEIGQGEVWNDDILKDLTGGDVITARFLRKEFFDFRPKCKLIVRGNNKPNATDFSSGMWERIHLVPFNVEIPPDKQDKYLREKIVERELSAVLTWALEGCLEWQRIGLAPVEDVTLAVKEYKQEVDVIGAFLSERTVRASGLDVKALDLYNAYKVWCDERGQRTLSMTAFGLALGQRNYSKVRNRHGIAYTHLTLKSSDYQGDEYE